LALAVESPLGSFLRVQMQAQKMALKVITQLLGFDSKSKSRDLQMVVIDA
jgi:hypothetical protein